MRIVKIYLALMCGVTGLIVGLKCFDEYPVSRTNTGDGGTVTTVNNWTPGGPADVDSVNVYVKIVVQRKNPGGYTKTLEIMESAKLLVVRSEEPFCLGCQTIVTSAKYTLGCSENSTVICVLVSNRIGLGSGLCQNPGRSVNDADCGRSVGSYEPGEIFLAQSNGFVLHRTSSTCKNDMVILFSHQYKQPIESDFPTSPTVEPCTQKPCPSLICPSCSNTDCPICQDCTTVKPTPYSCPVVEDCPPPVMGSVCNCPTCPSCATNTGQAGAACEVCSCTSSNGAIAGFFLVALALIFGVLFILYRKGNLTL